MGETQVEPVADILEELGYPTWSVTSQGHGSAVVIDRRAGARR
jgi:hypothetical protein